MACARSPTTVIEPLSERRVSIRSAIGVRSCASSTTMCPYVRISSGSEPLRDGPRAEQRERFVEQRDVGVGPHDVVDVLGPGSHEQLGLALVEGATRRESHERRASRTGRAGAAPA